MIEILQKYYGSMECALITIDHKAHMTSSCGIRNAVSPENFNLLKTFSKAEHVNILVRKKSYLVHDLAYLFR